MTILEILAEARESLARLTVNGLCGRNHAEKLVREDALAIFDKMAVEIERELISAVVDYVTRQEVG